MPGSRAGVAYFTIENRGDTAITINRIHSPQYDDVQMHETIIEDGVSRMRPLNSFQVAPTSSVEFMPGGKHLMLMMPSTTLSTGSSVTLEIQYDTGLLIINSVLQDRIPAQ
jgi:copper(I)-binding protein